MTTTRRQFIKAGLGGTALASAGFSAQSNAKRFEQPGVKPLSILLLGGTGFIGPHMVREALRRGHDITLFNRGKTNNALFNDLTTLIGDRNSQLESLEGKRWDVVIDNSGYVPRHVEESAGLLKDSAAYYLFISTVSVYESLAKPLDESAPLATIEDETVEEVTGETYGPLKALCEKRALSTFGQDRVGIIRPTYICGPGDHTDRYTWWPARSAQGGRMLWPGSPSDATQIVDVRDLANFTIDMVEQHLTGAYNAVTPSGQFTMGDMLADCQAVAGGDMEPVWVSGEFLDEQKLGDRRVPLPIWAGTREEAAGFGYVSGERAVAAGLRNRPTRETARDTLAWWQQQSEERRASMRGGMDLDVEAAILAAWNKQA